ncbi:MAG TPA: UdgX family uracil-DNA binding protein [Jatrophihabitans sp.]|jgi:DNA polymerase|nr:UdgX family uracil-DNA binding protein [Jatrophihabitans sp.]
MAGAAHFRGADQFVPKDASLKRLADAAAACQGCDLYERATQTVFGAGRARASVMLVGEQPGDAEDRQGKPFVGPAGRLLDRALDEAGIGISSAYITNAVKHFRWKPAERGKRRLHDKPSQAQVGACRPWLAAELSTVRPRVVVALGATAAGSLFGAGFRLTRERGRLLDWPPSAGPFEGDGSPVRAAVATIHPSAVLRAPGEDRDDAFAGLVHDLKVAAAALDD